MKHTIHNCHAHLFTVDYIPKYYLSPFLPTPLATTWFFKFLGTLFFRKTLNRFAAFLYSATKKDQEEVFKELMGYYPKGAKFCILTMDFDFMRAGPVKKDFLTQIEDLSQLAQKVNSMAGEEILLPFLCVDPRREGLADLVKKYIEEKNFRGLKIYPALGFFPDDPRLDPVYAYVEEKKIPITAHCIPTNINHYRGRIEEAWIEKARQVPRYLERHSKSKNEFARYFTHPYWYREVLRKFPNLKINFGHFGGSDEWDKFLDIPGDADPEKDNIPVLPKGLLPGIPDEKFGEYKNWFELIRLFLKTYPGLYADISFTVYDTRLYPLLKNLLSEEEGEGRYSTRDKVLFGTDFYMLQTGYRERRFGIDMRGYLDEDQYWQIAEVNPKRFLGTGNVI